MRFLIVSAVFPPEPVVSSQMSAQIAQALVERGHDVTVIAPFPSRPAGKLYPGYSRRLLQRQERDGFDLVRCFSFLSCKSSMTSRFLENISFGLTGGWVALMSRRPDVIYANTWPIFATGIVAIIARLRKIPLVASIQDIYPESLVSQRRIDTDTKSNLVCFLRWIDGLIVRSCRSVIVISESFATIYREQRRVARERLRIVPNWVDSGSVVPDDPAACEWRHRLGIPRDAFVIVYGGNVGMAAGVETVIEAFRFLKDCENMYVVIAGAGTNLAACQSLAKETGCSRVLFYTPWPSEETGMVLGAADLLMLPTRGQQSIASVPSKLITYMLAARPVLAIALPQTDLAETIERSQCGWVVEPDQPALLAVKFREVATLRTEDLTRRGQAGRAFALANLTSDVCLPQVIRVLEQAGARDGE